MKLLHTLPFLSLIISTLGKQFNLFGIVVCLSIRDSGSAKHVVLFSDRRGSLRGLGKFEPISGIQCDKSCMGEVRSCNKKCDVDSSGKVTCNKGKLPKNCKKQCCRQSGKTGERDGLSSISALNIWIQHLDTILLDLSVLFRRDLATSQNAYEQAENKIKIES